MTDVTWGPLSESPNLSSQPLLRGSRCLSTSFAREEGEAQKMPWPGSHSSSGSREGLTHLPNCGVWTLTLPLPPARWRSHQGAFQLSFTATEFLSPLLPNENLPTEQSFRFIPSWSLPSECPSWLLSRRSISSLFVKGQCILPLRL